MGCGLGTGERGPWQQPAGTKNRWRKSPKSQTQLIYVIPRNPRPRRKLERVQKQAVWVFDDRTRKVGNPTIND